MEICQNLIFIRWNKDQRFIKPLSISNHMSELQDKIRKAQELGERYESEYGACSQCVIAAAGEVLGNVPDDVFKAALPLAGGCCRSTEGTCGALAGGVMLISSVHGRPYDQFHSKDFPYVWELADKLYLRFKEEYGSIVCSDVQKGFCGRSYDLRDLDQRVGFRSDEKNNCPKLVGVVAGWVVELLSE